MSYSNLKLLPDKKQLEQDYLRIKPYLEKILSRIEGKVSQILELGSKPTLKSRVKKFDSYYRKLMRVNLCTDNSSLPLLTDLMGIRIICAFLEDLAIVEDLLKKNFTVKEIERKGASLNFKEFGYESIHILIEIPQEVQDELYTEDFYLPQSAVCEIQVRTILQDAWAEVEHELVYKSEFSPFDLPLKRKLASINASLSLADIIFQEIRDYQNKLNREIEFRRDRFYEKADALARESLPSSTTEPSSKDIINSPSPFVRGTIDDMLLDAIQAHNLGDLTRAVQIYTAIIESKPTPNNIILSVILKHRGMAYFAENKYEEALHDFLQSVEYQKDNFRSLYYAGIVYSVEGDNEKAVEYFNLSLAIDDYQSHVYYRRALAQYNLGNYIEASSDLSIAAKLGLDDEDCKKLRDKLTKKFDMNM